MPTLPNVPSLGDTFKGFEYAGWNGLYAPAGTPADVVKQLFTATHKALQDPELQAHYQSAGSSAEASESPAAFHSFMKSETAKWARVIQIAGVKAD